MYVAILAAHKTKARAGAAALPFLLESWLQLSCQAPRQQTRRPSAPIFYPRHRPPLPPLQWLEEMAVVLGAGVSGLSSALHLLKLGRFSSVQLVEATERVGGWMKSGEHNGVVYETGPRSIRAVGERGKLTLELIEEIGMADKLRTGSKEAGKHRFLYTGQGVVRLPRTVLEMFSSPVTKDYALGALRKQVLGAPPAVTEEETLSAFFGRQLGQELADDLVGAMALGIFAGDYRKLSVRECFPAVVEVAEEGRSLARGMLRRMLRRSSKSGERRPSSPSATITSEKPHQAMASGVFSVEGGLQAFADGLLHHMHTQYPGQFLYSPNTQVCSLTPSPGDGGAVVNLRGGDEVCAQHVVSTLPAHAMAQLVQRSAPRAHEILAALPFCNVAVVNLQFDGLAGAVEAGFGYLVPPRHQEPILGVIFDSFTFSDSPADDALRLTVMMGGDTSINDVTPDVTTMSPSDLTALAVATVQRHLSFTSSPSFTKCSIHSNAIPQYHVGHGELVREASGELGTAFGSPASQGSLSWVGNSHGGVGINDCIWNARANAELLGK